MKSRVFSYSSLEDLRYLSGLALEESKMKSIYVERIEGDMNDAANAPELATVTAGIGRIVNREDNEVALCALVSSLSAQIVGMGKDRAESALLVCLQLVSATVLNHMRGNVKGVH